MARRGTTSGELSGAEASQYLTNVIVLLRFSQIVGGDVLFFETKLLVVLGVVFTQDADCVSVTHRCGNV